VSLQQNSQETVVVLRRLGHQQWERDTLKPLPAGFTLRESEPGLSVFLASVQMPRQVLQKLLDLQHDRFQSGPQKLENWFHSNGRTVEDMVDRHHWRVERVAMSCFPNGIFQAGEANAEGYLQIYGTSEDFQRYSINIANQAILCTPEECKK
jgi:hypothetical protein